MKFVIHKPTQFIKIFRDGKRFGVNYDDVEEFYNILPSAINKLGYEYVIISSLRNYIHNPKNILLSWHTHGQQPNTWHLKSGYLPGYFYFDKKGFSGWSELTTSYKYDNYDNMDEVREEVIALTSHFIENNITRYDQHPKPLPKQPYVLVLDQHNNDVVRELAYIDNLPEVIQEAFAPTKYNVVVKTHPVKLSFSNNWNFERVNDDGPLHSLIAGAAAVYTNNSSAGFEALLHRKRVFTTGACDYHWATTTLKTENEIVESVNVVDTPVDENNILKFLHYCLTKYFVNMHDERTLQQKLQRAIDEFEQPTTI